MPNWNYFETFYVLSNNLSFSKTAKIMKTSQPAISRQIKSLEKELGHALFNRTKNAVSLTKEGIEFKQKISHLVEGVKEIFSDQNQKEDSIGHFKIGSIFEVGETFLHPKLLQFLEENSGHSLHLEFNSSKNIIEKILSGELDFGFVHTLPDYNSIRAYAAKKDHPVLVTTLATSLDDLQENKRLDFVSYRDEDQYTLQFLKKKFSKKLRDKVFMRYSVNSHESMIDFVEKFDGFAVMPMSSAKDAIAKKRIKIIAEETQEQPLYFCCNEIALLDKKKRFFLEKILKNLR
ncbi:MAG: LysR family transcriptional regulator [Bacteriovorax sp.]